MAPAADIDRLIEDGLNRYGSGDLDGALLIWEKALAIDPDNAQANSYVDYVRMNYEVLQTDSGLGVSSEPFGIEEEPEYIIEITQGHELLDAEAPAPLYMDPLDQGWFIEEEQTREVLAARTRSENMPAEPRTISADPISADSATVRASMQVLEMEADEPPELELAPPAPTSGGEVSFDSATREYGSDEHETATVSSSARPTSLLEELSSFRAESTPLGFGNLETEIKKRDLGFVQPTHGPGPPRGSAAHAELAAAAPLTTTAIDLELGGAGADDDLLQDQPRHRADHAQSRDLRDEHRGRPDQLVAEPAHRSRRYAARSRMPTSAHGSRRATCRTRSARPRRSIARRPSRATTKTSRCRMRPRATSASSRPR